MAHYLIQIEAPRHATLLWEASRPIRLGHPIRTVLERTSEGFRLRDLTTLEVREFPENAGPIEALGWRLSIRSARDWSPTQAAPQAISPERGQQEAFEQQLFRKSLSGATAALALLLVSSAVLPRFFPKQEELIPPQFALSLIHI